MIASVTRFAEIGEADPELMCEELLDECLEKQSKDNMSAIVVLLDAGRRLVTHKQPILLFELLKHLISAAVKVSNNGGGIAGLRAQRESAKAAALAPIVSAD